jgi:hypothetical protein
MNNIHLHSHTRSGLLKDDINKEQEPEYKKPLPYVVSSILPSEIFEECRSEIPNPSTVPADTVNRLSELINLLQKDSWTCKAEQNYYWTFGG